MLLSPGIFGPKGTKQNRVQAGDIFSRLQEAIGQRCCVWVPLNGGLGYKLLVPAITLFCNFGVYIILFYFEKLWNNVELFLFSVSSFRFLACLLSLVSFASLLEELVKNGPTKTIEVSKFDAINVFFLTCY